ncbi:hypothetical protein Pfo_006719 [Paulownia fortunei]|nr:hypothetical protein Pfo_006719 [Paulownia fortunei]
MVEGLVSRVATSVRKKTEHEFDEEQEDQETYNFSICHIKDGAFLPIRCCREWLLVLCLLIKCQHSLQSVTITDPEKQRKLVLRDEQLVEWRKNLLCGGFLNNFMPQTFRMGWLRELHLPLSG